jgi:Extensin-like protein C-terminus
MTRGVRWYLVSSLVLVALIALAGCSHYLMAEREPWRHEAELTCLNSGAVKETAARVRISAVSGPGACGMDYPLRVSALGAVDSNATPLSYDDETMRPPGSIPNGAMPRSWPGAQQPAPQANAVPSTPIQSQALPPVAGATPQPYLASPSYPTAPASRPAYPPPQTYPQSSYPQRSYAQPSYPQQSYPTAQAGAPLSLTPPGVAQPEEDDEEFGIPGGPPHPYYGGPAPAPYTPPSYPQHAASPAYEPPPPLGPPSAPMTTASAGPVEVKPPATLACPIVSALDQWITGAVQPAALHWFHQPVVEIKQISAYSCRGMNGNPNAHISEHAFGNALDVAEFDLADGHRVSVQYGWHGSPEEQGFLHDVQSAACDEFTTVLAPGANVYHYNHIHVDLMRHYNGRHICEPSAIPGEVAAARARAHYAAHHYGDPGVTGSIKAATHPLGYSGEDDDSLPNATPGED